MICTCVRCGRPIRQGTSYHMKRSGDIEIAFHCYDCTSSSSARLDWEGLFKNGAVICGCGEPLLTEASTTNVQSGVQVMCHQCKKVYEMAAVVSCRRPSEVVVAPSLKVVYLAQLPDNTPGLDSF